MYFSSACTDTAVGGFANCEECCPNNGQVNCNECQDGYTLSSDGSECLGELLPTMYPWLP